MTYRFKRKTKMIVKPMLSAMVLGVVAMCSVSSAQASRTNEYSTMVGNNAQIMSQKKDLSELGSRLQTRFSEVWQEVLGLVGDGVTSSMQKGENDVQTTEIVVEGLETSTIPESEVEISTSSFFSDIDEDTDRYFIETLASHGIIKGSNSKFSPDNYMSVGDFIKMLVDTYRIKVRYDLTTDAGLSSQSNFGEDVLPQERKKEINTAYELGFLTNVLDAESTQKSDLTVPVTTRMIDQIMENIQDQFPGMVQSPDLRVSDLYVKRGPAARYVVQGFDFAPEGEDFEEFDATQELYFTDIYGHQYAPAIKTLAELGIVNTQNPRFYPDNYLRNYEFTVMLVNALLQSKNQKFDIEFRGNQNIAFVDLDKDISYLPWINYAESKGLIDYLVVNTRGQNFFEPNSEITKHEVYHILEELTDFTLEYDQAKADQQRITRGQFASVLKEAFNLTAPKSTGEAHQAATENEDSSGTIDLLLQIRSLLSQLG